MTYNELRKKVRDVYDVQGLDVAIHQSNGLYKVHTDIVVSSASTFHKFTYVNRELVFVSGSDLYLGKIEQMKHIMEDEK